MGVLYGTRIYFLRRQGQSSVLQKCFRLHHAPSCYFQTLQGELALHQDLLETLRCRGQPFEPQVNDRVAHIETQWAQLDSSLRLLVNVYGDAAADWIGIQGDLDELLDWCSKHIDWCQRSVRPGEETETLAQIQVRTELDTVTTLSIAVARENC